MKRTGPVIVGCLAIGALTALWSGTRSVDPDEHRRFDSALRELRGLDRTINQDVLRARFQLVDSYYPVLVSYRRLELLEAQIAELPGYLKASTRAELRRAVDDYRYAVTAKQRLIESFKYQTADLKELLGYLPSAGSGVAQAASISGEQQLAHELNHVLQLALLYNLTSDESYAQQIRRDVDHLITAGESARSYTVKQRLRTFARNVGRLLEIKPAVDEQLRAIFDAPITAHEERVATLYFNGYARAEIIATRYRVALYASCVFLLGLVAYGFLRLESAARALRLANERLEERVAERTRDLKLRNGEMKAVLDNVEQALFTVNLQGHISRERSLALDRWFPSAVAGRTLWSVVAEFDPKAAEWLELGWEGLSEGFLPASVVLSQLPDSWVREGRHYRVAFQPIGPEEGFEQLLAVVTDVTSDVERSLRDEEQREQLVLFQHYMRDKPGLLEFFAESSRLAEEVTAGLSLERAHLFRSVHTLKGNCAVYGVTSVAKSCHELESKMVGGADDVTHAELQRVADGWQTFADKIRSLVGSQQEDRVEFSKAELRNFRQAVAERREPLELLLMLQHYQREPMLQRLQRLAEQAKSLARRLGRGELRIDLIDNGVRLDARRWAAFWSSSIHVLRNALDHGVETSEERVNAGKPAAATLRFETRLEGGQVVVEFADDGRGIDWEGVRARAAELGIVAFTEQELCELLFRGGLSTKNEVTEFSGRGTGVAACFSACAELGGTVTVETSRGRGTVFRFTIPSDDQMGQMSIIPAA